MHVSEYALIDGVSAWEGHKVEMTYEKIAHVTR